MFELIKNIKGTKKKKFFIEKVNIYIKYLKLISDNLYIKIDKNKTIIDKKTSLRLKELNIFNSCNSRDKKLLREVLDPNLFESFICAVNFNILNKRKIGNYLEKIEPQKRKKKQYQRKHNVVDFFCGAGGLSYGFIQENFKIVLANDNDEECIETYKFNHPEILPSKIILDDIKKIIPNLKKYLINKKVDVVIGGPPCQGFSNVNQQRIINDPRNKLYKYFIQAVKKINPKIVVMENVKGMYPYAEQVKQDMEPFVEYLPNTQFSQIELFSSLNFPAAQSLHSVLSSEENLPASHGLHCDEAFCETIPIKQFVQVTLSSLYLPAGHG